ncbi:MAG: hypothetical protein K2X81_13705, partial [Candidatus Obscuribacterales bacterium]|nr:hypothetical protein [Candidatus Obscuribacterales bacterium]
AEGRALSPVQLQKAVFLMQEQANLPGQFVFVAYDYGPFCSEIYRIAETLELEGLVSISVNLDRNYKTYAASSEGLTEGKRLLDDLDPGDRDFICKLVSWVGNQSFPDLVKAIYAAFPEYKKNSIFRGT